MARRPKKEPVSRLEQVYRRGLEQLEAFYKPSKKRSKPIMDDVVEYKKGGRSTQSVG